MFYIVVYNLQAIIIQHALHLLVASTSYQELERPLTRLGPNYVVVPNAFVGLIRPLEIVQWLLWNLVLKFYSFLEMNYCIQYHFPDILVWIF